MKHRARKTINRNVNNKACKLIKIFSNAQHYSRKYLASILGPQQDTVQLFLATAKLTSTKYATLLLLPYLDKYRWYVKQEILTKMVNECLGTKNYTILKLILKKIDSNILLPKQIYTVDRQDVLTLILSRFYKRGVNKMDFLFTNPKWVDLYLRFAVPERTLKAYITTTAKLDMSQLTRILDLGAINWSSIDIFRLCDDCYSTKLTVPILELFIKYGFELKFTDEKLKLVVDYMQLQLEKIRYQLFPGSHVLELMQEDAQDVRSFDFYKAYLLRRPAVP